MAGITLDTGALIALESRGHPLATTLRIAREQGLVVTVPTVVIVEWWKPNFGRARYQLLAGKVVEDLTLAIAISAGHARTLVPAASVTDATVMASAATRGDMVFTSDVPDLMRLREECFRGVLVRRV